MNKNLNNVYIFLLERTARAVQRYAKQEMNKKGFDINSDQWVILKKLSENEGINQRQIAALTFKEPASITRSLDILEKKGLIQRDSDINDRRTLIVSLTKNGKNYVSRVMPVAIEVRKKGLQGLTQQEIKVLKSALNKIYDNVS